MDKLSELIKEAKPLYRQRKRARTAVKTLFALSLPLFLFGSIFQIYTEGNNLYLSLDNNNLQHELLQDDLGLLR